MSGLEAFLFGVTLAFAIGPTFVLIVSIAVSHGLASGLKAGLGAALGDLTFALLAFFAGGQLAKHLHAHERSLKGVGALVLLAFGIRMIQQAMKPTRIDSPRILEQRHAPLFQTYVLTLINPLGVLAFIAFALQVQGTASLTEIIWLTSCLFAGSLLVQAGLGFVGHSLGRLLPGGRWTKIAGLASGSGIALFGLAGVYRWLSA